MIARIQRPLAVVAHVAYLSMSHVWVVQITNKFPEIDVISKNIVDASTLNLVAYILPIGRYHLSWRSFGMSSR